MSLERYTKERGRHHCMFEHIEIPELARDHIENMCSMEG